jgi:DNA-binding transcriptional ArsR family regulator
MDAFEAIAEPNRRRILDVLQAGERPAGDVVEALAISQPGVSKHLRLLREAGLVRVRADGQRRLYSVEPRSLAAIEDWLRPHLDFWRDRLDALEDHLEKEQ